MMSTAMKQLYRKYSTDAIYLQLSNNIIDRIVINGKQLIFRVGLISGQTWIGQCVVFGYFIYPVETCALEDEENQ